MTNRLMGRVDEIFGAPMREKKAKADEAAKAVAEQKAAAESVKKSADVEAQVVALQKKIHARERVLRRGAGARRKQKIDAAMVVIQDERAARGKRTLNEAELRSRAARRVVEGGE